MVPYLVLEEDGEAAPKGVPTAAQVIHATLTPFEHTSNTLVPHRYPTRSTFIYTLYTPE